MLTFENHVLWSLFQILSGGNRFYLLQLFQGFCENILKPIIQEAVSEALPPHLETATSAKKYYTVQQAAEIANVDISTIYRWKGKGTLTFLYIEGRTLISAEEFDAKIETKELVRYKHSFSK